jgi:hypothetical protein
MNEHKSPDERVYWPGTRVKAFNARIFRDDVSTPLSQTMQPATVVAWYGRWSWLRAWRYESLVDLLFDGEHRVSHGHFTDRMDYI